MATFKPEDLNRFVYRMVDLAFEDFGMAGPDGNLILRSEEGFLYWPESAGRLPAIGEPVKFSIARYDPSIDDIDPLTSVEFELTIKRVEK